MRDARYADDCYHDHRRGDLVRLELRLGSIQRATRTRCRATLTPPAAVHQQLSSPVVAEERERSSRVERAPRQIGCAAVYTSHRTVPYRSRGGRRSTEERGGLYVKSATTTKRSVARQHEETVFEDRQHVEGAQQLSGEGVRGGPPRGYRRGGLGGRYI